MMKNLSNWFAKVNNFEIEEKTEKKKKYNYYLKRSLVSVWELISMTQFRLSLYSIFHLTDEIELANIKIKKVRE